MDPGSHIQGTHSTGKTAQNIPTQAKHREFGNFVKTQGILFAQGVNALMLKVQDVAIFATTFFFTVFVFFQKQDRSTKSVLCM